MKWLLIVLNIGYASASACYGPSGVYECEILEACCPPDDYACMGEIKRYDPQCNYDGCANVAKINPDTERYQTLPAGCFIGHCFRFEQRSGLLFESLPEACPVKPATCPATTYSLNSECTACLPGHYCPGDELLSHICTACPSDQFLTSSCNTTHNNGCSNCSIGQRQHSSDPRLCVCKPGFIRLPDGTCEPCMRGTGSDTDDSTVCTHCRQGDYTLGGEVCRQCPARYYCEWQADCRLCVPGNMCPAGSHTGYNTCDEGTYCPEGSIEPIPCPPGYYCPRRSGAPIICPVGSHCSYGAQRLCRTQASLDDPSIATYCPEGSWEVLMCPQGYRCPNERTKIQCLPGTYCPNATLNPLPCTGLEYCDAGSALPGPCPGGFTCTNVFTKVPCPAGTFCNLTHNASCQNGSLCPSGSAFEQDCPAGWYCPNAASKVTCPAGFYCPARTASAIKCTADQTCMEGSEKPAGCPENFYCPSFSKPPVLCTGSMICPANTVTPIRSRYIPVNDTCPAGYMPHYDLMFGIAVRQGSTFVNQYDQIKMINISTGKIQVIQILDDIFGTQKKSIPSSDRVGSPLVMSDDMNTMYAFAYFERSAEVYVSELWAVNMSTGKPSMVLSLRTADNHFMRVEAACRAPNNEMFAISYFGVYLINLNLKTLTYQFGLYTYSYVQYFEVSDLLMVIVDNAYIRILDAETQVTSITIGAVTTAAKADFSNNVVYFVSSGLIKALDTNTALVTQIAAYGNHVQQMALLGNNLLLIGAGSYAIFDMNSSAVTINMSHNLAHISQPVARLCAGCEPYMQGVSYTDKCNYTCADGYWGEPCAPCSRRNCTAGSFPALCKHMLDTQCDACAPVANSHNWTDGHCNFTCRDGYFKDGPTCSPCTNPSCDTGMFLTQCNPHDSKCEVCPERYGPYTFTTGCDFTCAPNTYRLQQFCFACSKGPCVPGKYRRPCTETNSDCTQCPIPYGSFRWTSGCNFTCSAGHYLQDSVFCFKCDNATCSPGTYARNCTATANQACLACDEPHGNFEWVNQCEYRTTSAVTTSVMSATTSVMSATTSVSAVTTSIMAATTGVNAATTSVMSVTTSVNAATISVNAETTSVRETTTSNRAPTTSVNTTTSHGLPSTTRALPTTTLASTTAVVVISEVLVTINRSYADVCANTSVYVGGFCDSMRNSNPGDNFTCFAKSLNGIPCPLGVCTCVSPTRRLLQDSCDLVAGLSHNKPLLLTTLPSWAISATIKEIQETTWAISATIKEIQETTSSPTSTPSPETSTIQETTWAISATIKEIQETTSSPTSTPSPETSTILTIALVLITVALVLVAYGFFVFAQRAQTYETFFDYKRS